MSELPRKLGFLDTVSIIIGIVIGSGIFVLPNVIAKALPSAGAIFGAWVLAGVLSFCGALAYAELGAMLPRTGGDYVFLRVAYGPLWAFACAWTLMLAVLAGGSAWLAVTFSMYASYFVPLTPVASKGVSIALIAILSAVNYVGVKAGARVQVTLTILKIAAVVVLVTGAFLANGRPDLTPMAASGEPISLANFGFAMSACLMAYNGWSYVSFVAGEVRNPERNLLRALVGGMAAVAALYLLANAAYLRVMTIPEIAAAKRVAADVAARTMGTAGGAFVSAAVLLSVAGALNGCILTAARIPFAQARDGLFFARFGSVHPRFQTPATAISWAAVWTSILVITGSYETLYSYTIVAAWIFYTMAVAAVFILRRRLPDAPRPYRMWGYPWTAALFIGVSAWFIANAVATQRRPSLMALLIIGSGVAAYYLWCAGSRRTRRSPS